MQNLEKLALWYQISSSSYLDPICFKRLWQALDDDIEKVFSMSDEELLRIKGVITSKVLKGIRKRQDSYRQAYEFMECQLNLANKCGGGILTLDDPCYPRILRNSKNPHPLLYYIGDIEKYVQIKSSIAIVGTEIPSDEFSFWAWNSAYDFASQGWAVVSGMANGIDSEAHKGALQAKGKTIAVLGCGPDVIYPLKAKKLYHKIREKGLIVSEFPFGCEATERHLGRRHKTITAISSTTFVVQSHANDSAMNAVKACKRQGKKLFAITPYGSFDMSGNEQAIRYGAIPVPFEILLPKPDLFYCVSKFLNFG